jgi:glycosyltransferase involved in cell wall biosynthesis
MNILFVVYTYGNASGGHYHSLDQVSKEVSKSHHVEIVTFGSSISKVIKSNPHFRKHFEYHSVFSLPKLLASFYREQKGKEYDVIHFFDTESMCILLPFFPFRNTPYVLNKCGGPNPLRKKWYLADHLILFSKENYDWFDQSKFYDSDRLSLIPNRVEKLSFTPEEDRKEQKSSDCTTFLRVSRLGGAYDDTLMKSFQMISELKETFPVKLLVIGQVQDHTIFGRHQEYARSQNLPVEFITDERASNAKQFLYLADIAIGTGRSYMEAISLSIPTLAPCKNLEWPALVTKDNFVDFFTYNFSERTVSETTTEEQNRRLIMQLISDEKWYKKQQSDVSSLFEHNFDRKQIDKKYTEVYEKLYTGSKKSRLRLIWDNIPYLAKFFLGF